MMARVKYVYLDRRAWDDDEPAYEVEDTAVTIADSGVLAVQDSENVHWFGPGSWFAITTAPPGDDDG